MSKIRGQGPFGDTRMTQLARDNDIGLSTAYDYRDEAIAVLACGCQKPRTPHATC